MKVENVSIFSIIITATHDCHPCSHSCNRIPKLIQQHLYTLIDIVVVVLIVVVVVLVLPQVVVVSNVHDHL